MTPRKKNRLSVPKTEKVPLKPNDLGCGILRDWENRCYVIQRDLATIMPNHSLSKMLVRLHELGATISTEMTVKDDGTFQEKVYVPFTEDNAHCYKISHEIRLYLKDHKQKSAER